MCQAAFAAGSAMHADAGRATRWWSRRSTSPGSWRSGVATTAHLRLVERFTRVGPDTLLYKFTVDNPTVFTAPWSVALPMRKTTEQIYEFACHEGNYSLPNILKGARAEERATEARRPSN